MLYCEEKLEAVFANTRKSIRDDVSVRCFPACLPACLPIVCLRQEQNDANRRTYIDKDLVKEVCKSLSRTGDGQLITPNEE